MKRKNRTILLTSVISSIPLLAAGGYFGIKYSSAGDSSKAFDKQQPNDKLQGNGTKQNQSRDHISDFNFNNPVPKPKPKKDPLPLEIPKSPKPINILEDRITPFKPKKEIDKPIKITKAPHIEVKQSEIPTPKPIPNSTPSVSGARTPAPSGPSTWDKVKNFFSSPSSSVSRSAGGKKNRVGKTAQIHGVNVNIEVTEIRERETFEDDSDIKNRLGYTAQLVPDSVTVQVTDELITAAGKDATTAIKGLFAEQDFKEFKDMHDSGQSRIRQINLNWNNYYQTKFEKYEKLFMSDNVKNFLTQEGQGKYSSIVSISEAKQNHDKKIQRFLDLFTYLDYSKFGKVSQQVKDYLKKGLYIDKDNRNVYINENGELDSYSFSPLYNSVTSRLSRDNKDKRAFGFDSYWAVSPANILDNETPGWTNSEDLTQKEFSSYGVSSADGIKIYKKTKNVDNKVGKLNEGYVVDIDASNSSGFSKTKELIEKLKANNKVITQYRITNVGKTDENQDFSEIMKALPENLPQLTLILEGPNTKFLRHLESKKIDQLDLFTTKNNGIINGKSWSINPWALKGVAWVNTNDYNAGFDYSKYATIASRIVFNSLSFDEEDITKNNGVNDLTRINKGLRMAYYVRNNEGIFQGAFGNGLKPDHDEGNNSYPTELDLSRTSLKTLKGLQFFDKHKSQNKHRKLLKLTFKAENSTFELPAGDLDGAQYDVLDLVSPGPPRAKIAFSNNVTKIKLIGSGSLGADGFKNLNILLERGDGLSNQSTIQVDSTNTSLISSLKSRGFRVEESNAAAADLKLN